MIEFIILPESSLKDVWEWQMDNQWNPDWVSYDEWLPLVTGEHWQHWGVIKNGQFVACVSFEHQGEGLCEMHVQTRQRAHKDESAVGKIVDAPAERLTKQELIRVCRSLGEAVLDMGMQSLVAVIPGRHRPLQELALRCGMRPMSYAYADNGLWLKFAIHKEVVHGRRE